MAATSSRVAVRTTTDEGSVGFGVMAITAGCQRAWRIEIAYGITPVNVRNGSYFVRVHSANALGRSIVCRQSRSASGDGRRHSRSIARFNRSRGIGRQAKPNGSTSFDAPIAPHLADSR